MSQLAPKKSCLSEELTLIRDRSEKLQSCLVTEATCAYCHTRLFIFLGLQIKWARPISSILQRRPIFSFRKKKLLLIYLK